MNMMNQITNLNSGRNTKVLSVLTALMALAALNASAATETFDSIANGTALTAIGGSGVWYSTGGYTVANPGGVNGTAGLGIGSSIFNWRGQSFTWSTLAVGTKVTMGLDFQSSTTGKFDDDRVGWTITPDAATSTGSQFALQLDNSQETGMVVYWNSTRTQLNPLTGITASTWYRFNVEFTKLTDLSAGIVGTLTQLDGSGNLTGTPYIGSIADTSAFVNAPSTALFAPGSGATFMSPSFKNYNALDGNADNATFNVTVVPEPATWSLLAIGALALISRRRKA